MKGIELFDKSLHRLFYSLNPDALRCTEIDGFTFYHTKENRPETVSEFLYRRHEVYDIIPKLSGALALDIGANIGCYTMRLAERFGTVYAFEPNRQMLYLLKLNLMKNCIKNVIVSRAAVSDKDGSARLRLAAGKPYASTLEDEHYGISFDGITNVSTVSLDGFFMGEKIDFVKIDVEGHELSVLRGGRNILMKNHPLMAVEIHHRVDGDDRFCRCNVCVYLRELGFNVQVRDTAGMTPTDGVHWVIASEQS